MLGRGVRRGGVAPHGGGDPLLAPEHPAQVIRPRKPAQVGDHLQVVLPLQQQQLGGLQPRAGQVLAGGGAHLGREGPHQMAFAHAQRIGQVVDAVQRHVVVSDGLHRFGHQR